MTVEPDPTPQQFGQFARQWKPQPRPLDVALLRAVHLFVLQEDAFLIFGLILVLVMLLRPQGLLPSREREQELTKGTHDDTIIEDVQAETG